MQNDDKTVEAIKSAIPCINIVDEGMRSALAHEIAAALQAQAQPEAPVTDGLAAELEKAEYDYGRGHYKLSTGLRSRILTTLRQHDQGERDKALVSWLAYEADRGAEECRKAEAEDDAPFWRRYWAGYAKAFETMLEKATALKGATQ